MNVGSKFSNSEVSIGKDEKGKNYLDFNKLTPTFFLTKQGFIMRV